jgi:hypothetical protein
VVLYFEPKRRRRVKRKVGVERVGVKQKKKKTEMAVGGGGDDEMVVIWSMKTETYAVWWCGVRWPNDSYGSDGVRFCRVLLCLLQREIMMWG